MCGGAIVAPLAMVASSIFGGNDKPKKTQSYNPAEHEIAVNNPQPETLEPNLGIDNTDSAAKRAGRGKGSLKIPLRNPSVSVTGGSAGSGVSVPKG